MFARNFYISKTEYNYSNYDFHMILAPFFLMFILKRMWMLIQLQTTFLELDLPCLSCLFSLSTSLLLQACFQSHHLLRSLQTGCCGFAITSLSLE